jgi:hypothetical protein
LAATAIPSCSVEPAIQGSASVARLTLFFSLELLIVALLRLPSDLGFTAFAYADRGSWMAVIALVEQGRRPVIDFAYLYGLLPIWISCGWFKILGSTPYAYESLSIVISLTMAWSFARIVRSLELNAPGFAVAVIALPFAIMPTYPSIAHAVEAALLCAALAEHAAGRLNYALALAAAACFAKPSMGFVYGAIVLALSVFAQIREPRGWRAIALAIMPAAVVVLILSSWAMIAEGPAVLAATILPTSGLHNYAAFNMGFFKGLGSYFWYGASLLFYFGSVVAFWFAASAWLTVSGIVRLVRLGRERVLDVRDQLVLATALMQVLFVTLFFAGPTSWSYYSYILVIGVLAALTDSAPARLAVIPLIILAATGQSGMRAEDVFVWHERTRDASTANLWATAAQREDWNQMRAAIEGYHPAMMSPTGEIPLLFPEFQRNQFAYLFAAGVANPREFAEVLQEFEQAEVVVEQIAPDYGYALTIIPELQKPLATRKLIFKNRTFAVYR